MPDDKLSDLVSSNQPKNVRSRYRSAMTTTPIANPPEWAFLKPGRNKSKSAIPSRYNLNFQENAMKRMLLIAKRSFLIGLITSALAPARTTGCYG
jgi:hypothetical protein